MAFTEQDFEELRDLEREFDAAGWRGVELADRIDELRARRDSQRRLIVVGDPAKGFRFYGPVLASDLVAREDLDTNLGSEPWWSVDLNPMPLAAGAFEFTIRILGCSDDHEEVLAAVQNTVAGLIEDLDAAQVTVG